MSDRPAPLVRLLSTHPETAFDYLEFRRIISSEAARLAAQRATQADREAISSAWQALADAHAKEDPAEEATADVAFHRSIYAASHNRVMVHIMGRVLSMLNDGVFYDRARLYRREGVREMLLRQHKALRDAILARNSQLAAEIAEKHMIYARDCLEESRRADQRLEVSLRRAGRDSLAAVADRQG